jgi:hypothetical protein
MADEFDFPIETDPDVFLRDWVNEVRQYFPNFDPSPNSLAYAAARGLINMLAQSADVAAVIPPAIYRNMGSTLWGIEPNDPLPATANTTWTANDDAGYETIPAGTVVTVEGVLFETTDEVEFASGGATVVTPIGISALEEGAVGNDLGSIDSEVVLEEGYDHILGITLVAPTGNGRDGETTEDFTIRLRTTLRILYPFVAVRGSDLEIISRTVPGVYRALSIDNYDYPSSTANVAGVATLLLQGPGGDNVAEPVKDQVRALIIPDSRRLVNNVLYIEDPTRTPVSVSFEFTTHPGADPPTVKASAEGTIADFLKDTKWGLPNSGEEPLWTNKTIVSEYDIAGALDRVEGLDRVTEILIGLNADTPTAGDKTLTGVGPLTTPGTITGTAV